MSQLEPSGFNVSELFQTDSSPSKDEVSPMRRRSDSQSQVVALSMFLHPRTNSSKTTSVGRTAGHTSSHKAYKPMKRHQAEYYVTLVPLNDTFVKKHLHVPYYPETCKLGRPTGTKIKPHFNNGYFDSRVLSRTHACMYVEPKDGQLMIQDMGSSNGTFVNQNKIGSEPVPINIGDYINLGFNIQIETNHKQISAKVENINVVSNNPAGSVHNFLPKLTQDDINNFSAQEMKQFDFIQSIFSSLQENKGKEIEDEQEPESETTKAFESAMFGQLYPSLDSTVTGAAESNTNAGIFNNSRIVSAENVDSTLDALMANLAMVKQQNDSLATLEQFLKNYAANIDQVNTNFLQSELAKRDKLHEKELQEEREKYAAILNELEKANEKNTALIEVLEQQIRGLESANEDLRSLQQQAAELSLRSQDQPNAQLLPTLSRCQPRASKQDSEESTPVGDNVKSIGTERSIFCETPLELETSHDNNTVNKVTTTTDMGIDHVKKETEDTCSNSENIDTSDGFLVTENVYLSHLGHHMSQIKNQGMVLGLVVVVAGFLYKTSSK